MSCFRSGYIFSVDLIIVGSGIRLVDPPDLTEENSLVNDDRIPRRKSVLIVEGTLTLKEANFADCV